MVAQARSPGSCCHSLRHTGGRGWVSPALCGSRDSHFPLGTVSLPVWAERSPSGPSTSVALWLLCLLQEYHDLHRQCAMIPDETSASGSPSLTQHCTGCSCAPRILGHRDLPPFLLPPSLLCLTRDQAPSAATLRHAGNPLPSWFILI